MTLQWQSERRRRRVAPTRLRPPRQPRPCVAGNNGIESTAHKHRPVGGSSSTMLDVSDAVVPLLVAPPVDQSLSLILTGLIYLRGFRLLQVNQAGQVPGHGAHSAFVAGLLFASGSRLASPARHHGRLSPHRAHGPALCPDVRRAARCSSSDIPTVPLLAWPPAIDSSAMRLGPYFSMGWTRSVCRVVPDRPQSSAGSP